MTQDNAPMTINESDRKHSRWGTISLGITILFVVGELTDLTILHFFPTHKGGYVKNIYLPVYNLLNSVLFLLLLGYPIGLILALIGLAKDQKKTYSIWSLGICLVILVGVILLFIYQIRNGIGFY